MADCGADCVKFETIPDDCLRELFKYFTLRERLRFERVHGRWAQLLNYLWTRQKALMVQDSNVTVMLMSKPHVELLNREWPCSYPDHLVRECDVLKTNDLFSWTSCKRILRKCKRLSALVWYAECPADFGQQLRELCPGLRHVELGKRYSFDHFLSFDAEHMTCFGFDTPFDYYSSKPERAADLSKFLRSAKNLNYLQCEQLPKTLFDNMIKMKSIERLALGILHVKDNELIRLKEEHFKALVTCMPQLKGLRISSAGSIHLGKLDNLEEASFPRHMHCPFANFESFIVDYGHKLKHLRLSLPNYYLLDTICESCPDLVRFYFDGYVGKGFTKPINQLTKLKELGICSRSLCTPTIDEFKCLLSNCVKLRVIFLRLSKSLDPQVWQELAAYAGRYPKRPIQIILSAEPPKALRLPGNVYNVLCDRL